MPEFETLKYIVNELNSKVLEIKNKMETLITENNLSDRHVDGAMRDLDKKLDNFTSELNVKIHSEIAKIRLQITEMEGRITTMENTYEKLDKHLEENRKEANVQRRWFIGLIISVIIAVSGMVISIFAG